MSETKEFAVGRLGSRNRQYAVGVEVMRKGAGLVLRNAHMVTATLMKGRSQYPSRHADFRLQMRSGALIEAQRGKLRARPRDLQDV